MEGWFSGLPFSFCRHHLWLKKPNFSILRQANKKPIKTTFYQ
jgi:hypothetical protein